MTRRSRLFSILGVIAAVALILAVLTNLGGVQEPNGSASPQAAPNEPSGVSASADPGSSAEPDDSTTPPTDDDDRDRGDPDRADPDGREVPRINAAPGTSAVPGVGQPRPLVFAPLPRAATSQSGLAAGFPKDAIPPVPGSTLTVSSVASEDDRLQAGLVASHSGASDVILRHYRSVYATLGFTEAQGTAKDGSTAHVFIRGSNAVTLTLTPSAAATEYTVYAVLVTG